MVDAEGVLQALVVDVVEDPLLVERLLKLLAEPALALVPVDIMVLDDHWRARKALPGLTNLMLG